MEGQQKFHPSCGYATREVRLEWFQVHGLPYNDLGAKIASEELTANPDTTTPLYYWQLYSLLGPDRIEAVVKRFYERVYEDDENPFFRQAFTRIGSIDHHIDTQAAYWQDAFGGGKTYHGSNYRLKFHHEHNADQVMNAEGAERWMFHMGLALKEFEPVFKAIDPRIPPCIVDFLETKMNKYAEQFGWKFQSKDFDHVKSQDAHTGIFLSSLYGNTNSAENQRQGNTIYSRHELQSMSIKTIKSVCRQLQINIEHCLEKEEMIDCIANSGLDKVHVVTTPTYRITDLRAMAVSALKQMAKCLRIDISHCVEKKEIIFCICESSLIDIVNDDANDKMP